MEGRGNYSAELTIIVVVAASHPDEFGFDPAYVDRFSRLALWAYRKYWRVEAEGVSNVPSQGRALLAANHSGVIPYDGAMIRTAILAEHPSPRHARMLVADWAFGIPFSAAFLLRTGNVLAHPDNALRLLEADQLVGVFPEGVKGASKRFADRYRVGRFGRGGFVELALRTGAPIIPVAVVGGEEVHPVVADLAALGLRAGLPSLPITATFPWLGPLGLIPLPSKWLISFLEPIETTGLGWEGSGDQGLVLEIAEEVRRQVQEEVDRLRGRRTTAFY